MHAALVVLVFTLPALLAAVVGGVLAVRRPPPPAVRAAIQHFAAGVVFAATALELLPKERTEATVPVIVGFALGIALMLGLRLLEGKAEARGGSGLPSGLLLVTALDFTIDGLVLGMAFATGEKSGILLATALTLEVLFVALSVTTAVADAGVGRLAALAAGPGLALVLCVAAVVGRVLLGALPPLAFAVLLGVGIVAMLYLVTEELLVEAHEIEDTAWSVTAFFLGFLCLLVIEMLVD